MSYTKVLPDDGSEVINLLQIGDIKSPNLLSQSVQRLGSAQPVFFQTGQRAARSRIELRKIQTSKALAILDRDALNFCQGRKALVTDKDAVVWDNTFVHLVDASIKAGAGGDYLVTCFMEIEALPSDTETGI